MHFNRSYALQHRLCLSRPLLSEYGTHKTVKLKFWPWRSVRSRPNRSRCSLVTLRSPSEGPAAQQHGHHALVVLAGRHPLAGQELGLQLPRSDRVFPELSPSRSGTAREGMRTVARKRKANTVLRQQSSEGRNGQKKKCKNCLASTVIGGAEWTRKHPCRCCQTLGSFISR